MTTASASKKKASWDPEMKKLIAGFRKAKLPDGEFQLHPGVRVVDPPRWKKMILLDIEAGPRGTRGLMGGLRSDLVAFAALKTK